MKIKKVLFALISALLILPVIAKADDNLVKVYIFEAGGCPYCEAEIEYLEGLDSYNKKFTIVTKELYVDHVDWEQGADYQLGVKVANAFKNASFCDASYTGTPFVVISNLYAATGYNTDLESIINEAYEAGDKDIVSCLENGNTDCQIKDETTTKTVTKDSDIAIIVLIIVSVVIYLVKSTYDKKEVINAINSKETLNTKVSLDTESEKVVSTSKKSKKTKSKTK